MATARPGVDLTLAELVRLRPLAARLRLGLPDRAGALPDAYQSLHRGRGLEYDESRAYQPGDDFRNLDWRVSARTGRLHTKLFLEEREHALLVAVDAGPTMRFGSRVAFKWVAAARLAALLAWLAVENGDRVGGLVFGTGERWREQPPQPGRAGAMPLLRLLAETPEMAPGEDSPPPAPVFERLRQTAGRGAVVAVLSDFAGWDAAAEAALLALAAANDVVLLLTADPLEAELPAAGRYVFAGANGVLALDTGTRGLRTVHAAGFAAHRDRVAAACRRAGARLLAVSTADPPAAALGAGLLRRRRRG